MTIPGTTGDITYGVELVWGVNTADSIGGPIIPQTEIHMVKGASAAPTTANWGTLVTTQAGSTSYTHVLASDGARRWYRIRHVLAGYEPSTWLGNVDAKPTQLGDV